MAVRLAVRRSDGHRGDLPRSRNLAATHPLGFTLTHLTVRVPLALGKRGGRKVILTPSGRPTWAPRQTRVENSLIKAIARAYRWKQMMESGTYASAAEIATAEKINQSYLCRVLRLTLLAPDMVEAVLDGQQGIGPQLHELMKPFPVDWKVQKQLLEQCVRVNPEAD